MERAQACADIAIDKFVKKLGPPYYPNWSALIPGDNTNGWGATKPDWRVQADSMMDDFELCAGVKIGRNRNEIDKLRTRTLATFGDYLVEKATLATAKAAIAQAKARLLTVKASITTFTAR
ncbi:MAG: hypothetical protein J7530_06235 [Novosphingobium sp.]|nr:hypothetical protein [Novosphingobium sp.]